MLGQYTVSEIVKSVDNKRLNEALSTVLHEGFYEYHKALERESKCLSSAEGQLYDVLSDVMSMMFKREGSTYCAHIRLSNGRRSASIEDFVGERAEILQGVFDKIENPLLRFRIADVLWANRKVTKFKTPIRFAVAALDACLDLKVDQESWHAGRGEELWFRAITLAMSIGERGATYLERFSRKLLAVFEKCPCNRQSLLLPLARLMLESEMPLEDPLAIPRKLEDQLGSLDVDDVFGRNDHYDLILKWYDRLGLKERCADCMFLKAENNRVAGDKWMEKGSDPGLISGRYEEAQRCYDRLPKKYKAEKGVGELSKKVRRALHVAYLGMTKNMQHIKGRRIDIRKYVASSRERVQGLDFSSALCRFVGMHSVDVEGLKKNTGASLRKNPTLAFFAFETFENDRVAARSEGIDPYKDGIENTPRFHQWMLHLFSSQLSLEWNACLWPAYCVLIEEHKLEDDDYYSMVSQSKFVPENRRFMFARGLKAGYEGDFQTAASLLLPQIENAVRIHLKGHGCDTFHHDVSKEMDSEVGLSNLVERDEMSLLFDEGLCFEMRVLYGPPPNYNLRNQYAHGLVDDCFGCAMTDFLVWYNALRLVVLGCLKHPEKLGVKFAKKVNTRRCEATVLS